jgi:methionine synthase II (cobalamin-independent)
MAISAPIAIPTEQIGSIPGPVNLIERIATGESKDPNLAPLCEDAVLNTFERAETIGSPVVTNGAHRKHHHSATYAMHGIPGTAPDGFKAPSSDHHARGVLRLTRGPLSYKRYVNCGFSPFRHDTSTSRYVPFVRRRARVPGTNLAENLIGGNQ